MPRLSFRSQVMQSSMDAVSVVDVYDLASDIGGECEKIIDMFGPGSVKTLIPKCITALEMLEALATKNEQETSLIQELNDRIAKLEDEKVERAETKKKFEKEIETIEEAWRCETRELVAMVSRLQSDNLRMAQEQKNKDTSAGEALPDTAKYEDGMIQKLKEQVDKQRNELKHKDREILDKSEKIDQFIVEIDQLKNQNQESKKRFKTSQNQVKTLCEERADFLAKIHDQHKEVVVLKKQLGIAEMENEDLGKEENSIPRFTIAELKEVLNERNDLKNRVNDLEEELMNCRPKNDSQVESNVKPVEPEDEAPVQGPLPEEWYTFEDPWKRKNSDTGIRKFFRKLFTDNEGNFPKRSLSSLTKMTLSSSGPHTEIPI